MSAVLYAWRVKKEDWWALAEKIHQLYKEENFFAVVAKEAAAKSEIELFMEAVKMLNQAEPKVQLFDEGDTYLFRVLSQDYLFHNNAHKFGLEEVFYDGRSDIPAGKEHLIKIVDWVDEQIKSHKYFLWPIITGDDLFALRTKKPPFS